MGMFCRAYGLIIIMVSSFCPVAHALMTTLSHDGESISIDWPDAEGWEIYQNKQRMGREVSTSVVRRGTRDTLEQGELTLLADAGASLPDLDACLQVLLTGTKSVSEEATLEVTSERLRGNIDSKIGVLRFKNHAQLEPISKPHVELYCTP